MVCPWFMHHRQPPPPLAQTVPRISNRGKKKRALNNYPATACRLRMRIKPDSSVCTYSLVLVAHIDKSYSFGACLVVPAFTFSLRHWGRWILIRKQTQIVGC